MNEKLTKKTSFSVDDLWAIWNGGKASAIVAFLKGGTSVKEREEILYSAWSEAVGRMMKLIPGKDDWPSLSMEERLDVMKEKTFSFQNFKNSIYDPQFELRLLRLSSDN
jgi:hypothetical protein